MHDINNSLTTLHRLNNLLHSAELSDVQLIVGDTSFYAHKLILSMSSDVLKAMLTNPVWPEFYQSEVVLVEDKCCELVFHDFLKYLYTGSVHLNQDSALPLLNLADKYAVPDLCGACAAFICDSCENGLGAEYASTWLRYARLSRNDEMTRSCYDFVTRNFDAVAATADFVDMSCDLLTEFLRSSDLIVHDEMSVYRAAKRWLMSRQASMKHSEYRAVFIAVLSCVRFPMLNLSDVLQIHDDTFVTTSPSYQFVLDLLQESDAFNKLPLHSRRLPWRRSDEYVKFHPRNYTNEKWNSVLVVEDFANFPANATLSMIFFSPISGSDADNAEAWEWCVELYPKGVYYDQSIMIGLQESLMLPSAHYRTVRLAVKCKSAGEKRVHISVLIISRNAENHEFVKTVKDHAGVYTRKNDIHNVDDIIPFHLLVDPQSCERYLTGGRLKVAIIIKPVN